MPPMLTLRDVDSTSPDARWFTIDTAHLAASLDDRLAAQAPVRAPGPSLYAELVERGIHMFASSAVAVAPADVRRMEAVIRAVEDVVATPVYRERALERAPAIARLAFGPRAVFQGYDFHLGAQGPKLIEINTNAGGGLLNAHLAQAQQACCNEIRPLAAAAPALADLEGHFLAMFRAEWALQRGEAPLRSIAIVDDDPDGQFLHPEFRLFQALFEKAGLRACIADPREFTFDGSALRWNGNPVDLVYNRLTDFYLDEARHAELRAAYEAGAVVLTPHPHAHALYADKRNLIRLSDPDFLAACRVPDETARTLLDGIPQTRLVTAENREALWDARRRLFFKPAGGYGGKATYRGDKLTKRVWDEIGAACYVAQELVPPDTRTVDHGGAPVTFKLDVRNYVYDGRVQLLAGRLYQGQTTNFRTAGGGFAPVYTAASAQRDGESGCC